MIASYGTWNSATSSFDDDYITDALKYTDSNSVTWFLIPLSYFTEAFKTYGFTFDATECPFQYAPNAESTGTRVDASYVTVDGEYYIRVQDTTGYSPNRSNVYYTKSKTAYVITDTVSPSGTVINLFDYWTTGQDDIDVWTNSDTGVNEGHTLKFSFYGGNSTYNAVFGGLSTFNVNQGKTTYSDIVQNQLVSSYPALNGTTTGSTESLDYLFNPKYTGASSYRATYSNVQGLLIVDEDGYYSYNSDNNYAEFDSSTNSFTIYSEEAVGFFPFDSYDEAASASNAEDSTFNHYFGVTLTTKFVQENNGYTSSSEKTPMTFEFSGDDDVWIFIDGVLVADLGDIHSAISVVIDFSTGDVTIKNSDEDIVSSTTIADAYTEAGVYGNYVWDGNTYENGTYHTLKFYYLERGNSSSNLMLKFNLSVIPETSISKVNQYGEAIEDAGFAVYSATKIGDDYYYLYDSYIEGTNTDYELATAVSERIDNGTYYIDDDGNICVTGSTTPLISAKYVGTTDSSGEMTFVDDDLLPYTLTELEEMFGTYFIAREISVPEGYRLVSEDIYLRIVNHQTLDCDNTYESGVYAAATELITSTDTIYAASDTNHDSPITYYDPDEGDDGEVYGTLFAVVMKYVGTGDASTDTDASHWAPVYGTDEIGYTVMSGYTDAIEAAIDAAKMMENSGYSDSVFDLSTSGSMQVYLTALPGDIGTYYYLAQDSTTQYTVAVYYTTADSLDGADSSNTVRIDATSFTRIFGASIQVPNLSNMLLVQKLDVYGNLVNGARFALYEVEEVAGDKIYYVGYDNSGTKTLIYLYPDDDGDNAGTAELQGGSTGTYTISSAEDSTEGVITVVIDGTTYTITPKEVETTVEAGDQTSAYTGFQYTTDEDGTAVFDNLEEEIGTYYIREISAPSGYLLNTTEVMVLVTSSTVYANAGTATDNVSVARSAGYIVSTLDQMAVIGDIDNTLSWIYTTLQVNTSQANTFNFTEYVEATNALLWNALSEHAYLEYDGTLKSTINDYVANSYYGSNTTKLSTDVGWSYLQIFQDTAYHQARVDAGTATSYAYTEISTPITSLYSRSVYVQVTDQFVQVELPETGGVSLPVAYAAGSLMIIISAALLILRRNKKSIHE
ncbi:MAG: LPXTG cell wall anchor domain-containing protein [Ruminococcus sp.]|nr:LPXTG cell wall anchor domain-containing protein [Ruminococcus sp.]